jgi:hypothetical protein
MILLPERSTKNRLKQRFRFVPHLSHLFYISRHATQPHAAMLRPVWGQGWGVLMMNTELWLTSVIYLPPTENHVHNRHNNYNPSHPPATLNFNRWQPSKARGTTTKMSVCFPKCSLTPTTITNLSAILCHSRQFHTFYKYTAYYIPHTYFTCHHLARIASFAEIHKNWFCSAFSIHFGQNNSQTR